MKSVKIILAAGLATLFFVGCSATAPSGNASNANGTSNGTGNAKTSASPASTASQGQTFTHHEGGIQFTLPAGWKSKNEGDTMTVSTPDDALAVVFWVPQGDDFNKAIRDMDAQLKRVVKNPKVTTPGHELTHNGMRAYSAAGQGQVNGQPAVWEVDILEAKKPVFVVSFAAPSQFSQHENEYNQLLQSIKRAD